MAKPFNQLRDKISKKRQEKNRASANKLIAKIALQTLRRSLNLTQKEIAKILAMTQASVSKIESQDDMYISTLNRFVIALGGKLKLVATFPNKEFVINQFGAGEE